MDSGLDPSLHTNNMAEKRERQSKRTAKKCAEISRILVREEVRAQMKRVSEILKKDDEDRTEEENFMLQQSPDVVHGIKKRAKTRELAKQRQQEVEDSEEELEAKCDKLAEAIKKAKALVVYSGAGISTAASIPDYRGPNGVWTLLQQGKEIEAQDLSDAEPTFTHMCITNLYQESMLKHVVSQNCDGLHIRSGLPRSVLSELHGNMYIELCTNCQPQRQYTRLFDTTERTGVRRHGTERLCPVCGSELRDSIVHFGEKSPGFKSPYNWEEAAQAADNADLILCLGTSLKVLKKYPCLWSMHKPMYKRPTIYIVNLQWTPKDDVAAVKINGKCDQVMKMVADRLHLTVLEYRRELDPIFTLASPLADDELDTTSKKVLVEPPEYNRSEVEAQLYRFSQPKVPKKRKHKQQQEFTNSTADKEPDIQPGKKKKKGLKKKKRKMKPTDGAESSQGEAETGPTEKEELLSAVGSILPGSSESENQSVVESMHTVMAPPITPPPTSEGMSAIILPVDDPATEHCEDQTVTKEIFSLPAMLAQQQASVTPVLERILPAANARLPPSVKSPPQLIPLQDVDHQEPQPSQEQFVQQQMSPSSQLVMMQQQELLQHHYQQQQQQQQQVSLTMPQYAPEQMTQLAQLAQRQVQQQAQEQMEAERKVAMILAEHKRKEQLLKENSIAGGILLPSPTSAASTLQLQQLHGDDGQNLSRHQHQVPAIHNLVTTRESTIENPTPGTRAIHVKSRSSIIIHTGSASNPDRYQTVKLEDTGKESHFPTWEGAYIPADVQLYLEEQSRRASLTSPVSTPDVYQPETVMVSPVSSPAPSTSSKIQAAYQLGVENAKRHHQALKLRQAQAQTAAAVGGSGEETPSYVPLDQMQAVYIIQNEDMVAGDEQNLVHLADVAALSQGLVARDDYATVVNSPPPRASNANVSKATANWLSALERTRPPSQQQQHHQQQPPQQQPPQRAKQMPHTASAPPTPTTPATPQVGARKPDLQKAAASWSSAKQILEQSMRSNSASVSADNENSMASNPGLEDQAVVADHHMNNALRRHIQEQQGVLVEPRGRVEHWVAVQQTAVNEQDPRVLVTAVEAEPGGSRLQLGVVPAEPVVQPVSPATTGSHSKEPAVGEPSLPPDPASVEQVIKSELKKAIQQRAAMQQKVAADRVAHRVSQHGMSSPPPSTGTQQGMTSPPPSTGTQQGMTSPPPSTGTQQGMTSPPPSTGPQQGMTSPPPSTGPQQGMTSPPPSARTKAGPIGPERLSRATAVWEHAKNLTKMNANLANLADAAVMESNRRQDRQGLSPVSPAVAHHTTTEAVAVNSSPTGNLSQLAQAASMVKSPAMRNISHALQYEDQHSRGSSQSSAAATAQASGNSPDGNTAARFPAIVQAMLGSAGVGSPQPTEGSPSATSAVPKSKGRRRSTAQNNEPTAPQKRRRRTTSGTPSVAKLLGMDRQASELHETANVDQNPSQLAQFADIANKHAAATTVVPVSVAQPVAHRPQNIQGLERSPPAVRTMLIARPTQLKTPNTQGTSPVVARTSKAVSSPLTNQPPAPGAVANPAPAAHTTPSARSPTASRGASPARSSSTARSSPADKSVEAQLAADMIARSMATLIARSAGTMSAKFMEQSVAYMNAQIIAKLGEEDSPSEADKQQSVNVSPTVAAASVSSAGVPSKVPSPSVSVSKDVKETSPAAVSIEKGPIKKRRYQQESAQSVSSDHSKTTVPASLESHLATPTNVQISQKEQTIPAAASGKEVVKEKDLNTSPSKQTAGSAMGTDSLQSASSVATRTNNKQTVSSLDTKVDTPQSASISQADTHSQQTASNADTKTDTKQTASSETLKIATQTKAKMSDKNPDNVHTATTAGTKTDTQQTAESANSKTISANSSDKKKDSQHSASRTKREADTRDNECCSDTKTDTQQTASSADTKTDTSQNASNADTKTDSWQTACNSDTKTETQQTASSADTKTDSLQSASSADTKTDTQKTTSNEDTKTDSGKTASSVDTKTDTSQTASNADTKINSRQTASNTKTDNVLCMVSEQTERSASAEWSKTGTTVNTNANNDLPETMKDTEPSDHQEPAGSQQNQKASRHNDKLRHSVDENPNGVFDTDKTTQPDSEENKVLHRSASAPVGLTGTGDSTKEVKLPTAVVGSAPGWFGKGINWKRNRRKKSYK